MEEEIVFVRVFVPYVDYNIPLFLDTIKTYMANCHLELRLLLLVGLGLLLTKFPKKKFLT